MNISVWQIYGTIPFQLWFCFSHYEGIEGTEDLYREGWSIDRVICTTVSVLNITGAAPTQMSRYFP